MSSHSSDADRGRHHRFKMHWMIMVVVMMMIMVVVVMMMMLSAMTTVGMMVMLVSEMILMKYNDWMDDPIGG